MNRAHLILIFATVGQVSQLYGQGGMPLWTNRYNVVGGGDALVKAAAIDRDGNVFVTGSSRSVPSTSSDWATVAYSNDGAQLWTNRYRGPGSGNDGPYSLAVDSSGNVFVAGYAVDPASSSDYVTIKYSGAGLPLWTNRYSGFGYAPDGARAVAVNTNGDVYVTGGSQNTNSYYDIATIAYSSSGVAMWTNIYNGSGNGWDEAKSVAVGESGRVFVLGYSEGNLTSADYVTLAYASSGVPLWTNRYNGPGNDWDDVVAIVLDGFENVLVSGYSPGTGSDADFATIKYTSTGVPLWTRRYNGPANGRDEVRGLAVDLSGNVFVAGESVGNGSDYDYAIVAYSSTGVALWTNRYNGPANRYDGARAVAVDRSGNVFVTGYSGGGDGGGDCVTLAYTAAGLPLWTNRYNAPGNLVDQGVTLGLERLGNVFVSGHSMNTNGGYYDYFTIKYSSSVPAPYLGIQPSNTQMMLTWTNATFNLQSAPTITGTFTNIPGATSPFTNPISGAQQFFRLISN